MKRNAATILLMAAGAILLFGIVQLLILRYEQGDVYPAYSSLRADPLGTMAFYESLDRVSGVSVRRDYSAENRLPEAASTAYLHLAAAAESLRRLPLETAREIERFIAGGGRLVITLYPESSGRPEPEPSKKAKQPQPEEEAKTVAFKDRWGVDFAFLPLQVQDEDPYRPVRVRNAGALDLPDEIDWHSGIVLTGLSSEWHPIYAREAGAVVAERRVGQGTMVMATDSYFVSNEGLQRDRNPKLLAWLIGSSRTVVFDEAHFGVTETPGVATLIRRYRLQGLAAALFLLAGLFVWKNSVSLLPRAAGSADSRVAGKDAASGFVNLLRRSVAPGDLLAVCFAEWKSSAAPAGALSARRMEQAEAAFNANAARAPRDRDPVGTYKTIAAILHNKTPIANVITKS